MSRAGGTTDNVLAVKTIGDGVSRLPSIDFTAADMYPIDLVDGFAVSSPYKQAYSSTG